MWNFLASSGDGSASGLLCRCPAPLAKNAMVEMPRMHQDRAHGRRDLFRQRYGFRITEKQREWGLQ